MNCYHQYPARTAFGGDKTSGVGPENHRMMLDTDSQTTCLPVRYDPLVAAHRQGPDQVRLRCSRAQAFDGLRSARRAS
jgi:hypothetical protein